MKTRIPYTKPSITELEINYATDAAAYGWGDRCYEYIDRFENTFKSHLGVKHAIAVSSCTGALYMGMAALGIGQGDEVIMADTNWIATAAPVIHLGAKPILVDILPDTWCIDPDLAEAAITPRTKAIIAVHLYGNLCDMDRLLLIAKRHGIALIEDAAEAIGSIWFDRRAGSMGTFGAFSFHGTKTVTTGEGGMFVTNDDSLYETVLTLSNHGRARGQSRQFWPDLVGFKYKMSNIQAAIGCAQIERIEELVADKRRIFHRYQDGLQNLRGILLNTEVSGTQNGYWMPTAVFDESLNVNREQLEQGFFLDDIDARVFFWPLSGFHFIPTKVRNLHSQSIPARAMNLPSYHGMTDGDISRVIAVIYSVLNNSRSNGPL